MESDLKDWSILYIISLAGGVEDNQKSKIVSYPNKDQLVSQCYKPFNWVHLHRTLKTWSVNEQNLQPQKIFLKLLTSTNDDKFVGKRRHYFYIVFKLALFQYCCLWLMKKKMCDPNENTSSVPVWFCYFFLLLISW